MGFIRIPISLKVDEDSPIYKDMIEGLRDTKNLVPLIQDLLTVYYESDEFNRAFSRLMLTEEMSDSILENLERIKETSRTNMQNSKILSDVIERTKTQVGDLFTKDLDDLFSEVNAIGVKTDNHSQESPTKPQDLLKEKENESVLSELLQEIKTLKQELGDMKSKNGYIEKDNLYSSQENEMIEKQTGVSDEESLSELPPTPQKLESIREENERERQEQENLETDTETISETISEAPKQRPPRRSRVKDTGKPLFTKKETSTVSNKDSQSNETVDTGNSEPQEVKPASFSKLLSSIKKSEE